MIGTASPPANANGHRRRELRARVLAEETHCYLCEQPVDKTLGFTEGEHGPRCTDPDCAGCTPHPMRAEVDEVTPRVLGGSPIARDNTHLTHRRCNAIKADKGVERAKRILAGLPEEPTVTTALVDW